MWLGFETVFLFGSTVVLQRHIEIMVNGSFFDMTFKKAFEEDANITTRRQLRNYWEKKTYFKDL